MAGGRRGRGPQLQREVGLAERGLLVPLPLLLQAQAQVVVGKVCGAVGGGGGWLRRETLWGVTAAGVAARGREGGDGGG